ncbi:MAG: hypothetical protein ABL984_05465 [Pyrinomonadaceae bacterium]
MDEYLWNKTGSDPEIERIEAALKVLAYRPAPPPELPAKQQKVTAPRRSFFRLSLSFAAGFLALVAIGSMWLLRWNGQHPTQQAAVKTVFQTPVTAVRTETAAPAIAVPPIVSPVNKPRRRATPLRPPVSNAIRPQTLVLTQEEADAYRQLMTALTITSTNLKIVKDKLDGTE